MGTIAKISIAFIVVVVSASCNTHPNNVKKDLAVSKTLARATFIKNKLLLVNGDSLRVSIAGRFVTVSKKQVNNYDSVYSGIYQIDNDSIHSMFSTQINDILYFTTFENVGMGYRGFLYAFDLKKREFVKSNSTQHDYVFSSGGIFFLNKQYIFDVCKPGHQNPEDPFKTAVEIYRIRRNKFHYLTYITSNGEMIHDDTSIAKLYHKAINYK
jgi:hypothetical protein